MRKILRKFVTLVLLISLIGSIAYTSSASTVKSKNDMISSSTYGNSTIETYEDSNFRLVKYFENDICIQEALLIKDTGEIYYNDISSRMYTAKSLDNLTASKFNYVQKYNTSDFVTSYTEPTRDSDFYEEPVNYSYICCRPWYDDNVYNFARLYGGIYIYSYTTNSWTIPIGTQFSVACVVLGFIDDIGSWIATFIDVVGGVILEIIFAKEIVKDYCWKYMINKIYPVTDRFTAYSGGFVYRTDRRYDLPDYTVAWETIYDSSYYYDYYSSSAFHEELIDYIGYYFIY